MKPLKKLKDNPEQNLKLRKGTEYTGNLKSPLQKKEEKRKMRKKITAEEILELCKKNLTINDMAKNLDLTTVSVATHIERILRKKYDIDINNFVTPEIRSEIEEAFLSLKTSSIKRIAENLQGKASVEQIRIVRGYLTGKEYSQYNE